MNITSNAVSGITTEVHIFQTYIADTAVDVHYFKIIFEKKLIIGIKDIVVSEDNRPLYRTKTKELYEAIIKLIQEALAACTP